MALLANCVSVPCLRRTGRDTLTPVTATTTEMQPEERAALRAAGRRAAASLPLLSPEACRRVAALMREPMNQVVKAECAAP